MRNGRGARRLDADSPLRAVANPPHELTARRVDVVAAGLADRSHVALVDQRLLERKDARARAGAELGAGERVPRNELNWMAATRGERVAAESLTPSSITNANVTNRAVPSIATHVEERSVLAVDQGSRAARRRCT